MSNKSPEPEMISAMIDSIKVYYADHEDTFSSSEKRIIENFPSKSRILNDMDNAQRDVVYRSVKHFWKQITGQEPDFALDNRDAVNLDGSYWMMPGGVLLAGFNHFQAAKENRILVCSILNINPLVFEKLLASGDTGEVINLIIARGGVRTLINREKNEVVMQTSEASWPWVKDKLERMYHKNKIAKVVDLSKPYEGWTSGVTIRIA